MKAVGVILLAVAAAAPTASADQSYSIRLTARSRVGDRYRIDIRSEGRVRHLVTLDGRVVGSKDEESSVQFAAVTTVLAVDSRFAATRLEYLVESCSASSSGKTAEPLGAGQRLVVAYKDGKTILSIDGKPPPSETAETLSGFLAISDPSGPTEDDTYGTREGKRVGDTWVINAAETARYLATSGISVPPKNLKGTVRLAAVRKLDSVEVLELSIKLLARNLGEDSGNGVRLKDGVFDGDFEVLVPRDVERSLPRVEKIRTRIEFGLAGEREGTGEKIGGESSAESKSEIRYSPFAPTPTPSHDEK